MEHLYDIGDELITPGGTLFTVKFKGMSNGVPLYSGPEVDGWYEEKDVTYHGDSAETREMMESVEITVHEAVKSIIEVVRTLRAIESGPIKYPASWKKQMRKRIIDAIAEAFVG